MRPIISFLFLAFGVSLIAQSNRLVLVEHFTNTECPTCTSRNPALHSTLEDYEGKAHHISYHPPYPYSSCIYYQANKEGNQTRATFYDIPGSPRAVIDGVRTSGSKLITPEAMDAAFLAEATIEISVTEDIDAGTANIAVKTTGNAPTSNIRLFVALVEAETDYNSPNGEKKHYNVFRKFINNGGSNGQTIALASSGASISFDYNFSLENNWMKEQMYVLAFVQNVDSKAILNSAAASDLTSGVSDFTDAGLIRLSPNPVREQLLLKSDVKLLLEQPAKIYSTTGQLMKAININNSSQLSLNVSALEAGVYFLNLHTEKGKVVKKFVKQ